MRVWLLWRAPSLRSGQRRALVGRGSPCTLARVSERAKASTSGAGTSGSVDARRASQQSSGASQKSVAGASVAGACAEAVSDAVTSRFVHGLYGGLPCLHAITLQVLSITKEVKRVRPGDKNGTPRYR